MSPDELMEKIIAALKRRATEPTDPPFEYQIPEERWYPRELFGDEETPFLN
jgi:hypothetical protein